MMNELSLHIIDLVQNSVRAKAKFIEIILVDDEKRDEILLVVKDDGKGIRNDEIEKVVDPFYTTKKKKKVGLGISLLYQTTLQCDGDFKIVSAENKGTIVFAKFKRSHIDLPPIGNIEDTLLSLLILTDSVDFKFVYRKNNTNFVFDTRKIKKFIEGVPIMHPEVMRVLKKYIRDGLRSMENKTKGGNFYAKSKESKNS